MTMTQQQIADQVNDYVRSRYNWIGATLTAGKINIRNKKNQLCGSITIEDRGVAVSNVMLGRQNLMGALAKQEIREFVERIMLDATAENA